MSVEIPSHTIGVGRPRKMETDHYQTQGAERLAKIKLFKLKLEAWNLKKEMHEH